MFWITRTEGIRKVVGTYRGESVCLRPDILSDSLDALDERHCQKFFQGLGGGHFIHIQNIYRGKR